MLAHHPVATGRWTARRQRSGPRSVTVPLVSVIACLAVHLLLVLLAGEATGPAPTDPPILLDLGQPVTLLPGTTGTVTFALVLPGVEPFLVRRVNRSCGCLASGAPARLDPGTTCSYPVQVHAGRLRGLTQPVVSLWGEVAGRPAVIVLRVQLSVEDYLDNGLDPWRPLDLGTAPGPWGRASATRAFLRGSFPQDWDQVLVEAEPGDHASCTLEATIDGQGSGWCLAVTATGRGTLGTVAGQVRVRFLRAGQELDHHPTITVHARIDGPVRCQPGELLIGTVPVDGQAAAWVVLSPAATPTASPLSVARITPSDPERFSAQVEPTGDGSLRLVARCQGRMPLGPVAGHLDVVLANPPDLVVRIPCLAAITP